MTVVLTKSLQRLFDVLEHAGIEARVVGGAVRDYVRGAPPADVDLATPTLPGEMVSFCQAYNITYVATGLQHGTITLLWEDDTYEITTLRVDAETDGRHAKVVFTQNWQIDAERRDFTINALSMDRFGEVYDYFNGLDDLRHKLVRFVGNAEDRIKEDYLRILRWFRFVCKLTDGESDWRPSVDDLACVNLMRAHVGGMNAISGSRIWVELKKILPTSSSQVVFDLMDGIGLLAPMGLRGNVSRELAKIRTLTQDPVTLLSTSEFDVAKLTTRLPFSLVESRLLTFLANHRATALDLSTLQMMATTRSIGKAKALELVAARNLPTLHDALLAWDVPTFPVGGDDLLSLGYVPGPSFGATFRELEQLWRVSGYQLDKSELLSRLPPR